jgi:hypothetical protein
VRNTEWGESQKNPLIYSIIGKLALSLRLGNRSRMSREVHVRCCEQLEGKFLGLTRLSMYTKSKAEARKIGNKVFLFLKEKLDLPINREKSGIRRPINFEGSFLIIE